MTTPKYKSQEGPYVAYQSLVDSNCWIVRFGTLGPVYDYPTPVMAANACDALNAAYTKGYAAGQAAQWHKAGEFPPDPIPEGHILIGYSNRKAKDEDYSLRQLACYAPHGPWTDWYGHVPNPDRWAIIPIPDKDEWRWYMPKRCCLSSEDAGGVSVEQIMEVVDPLVIWDGTSLGPNGGDAQVECRDRLSKLLE